MENQVLRGKTLLVVDDETDLREIVSSELEFMGAKVFQAHNVSKAKGYLAEKKFDLIVSDIRMPGETGIDLLNFVKAKDSNNPPMILITGFADISLEDAFNQGAEAILNKPFKLDDLINTAQRLTVSSAAPDLTPAKEMKLQFPETLSGKMKKGEGAVGRGGISLTIPDSLLKWDAGDMLNFQITFSDCELTGKGNCRWWKHQEKEDLVNFGMEFIELEGATSSIVADILKNKKMISYIPRLF